MLDPEIVSDGVGLSCVNLGVGGAGAADSYLLLHSFLQKNRTETVLLEVDYLLFHDGFKYPFSDYIWLCYDDDAVVRDLLIEQRGALRYWLWRAIPFLRFVEFSGPSGFIVGRG